MSSSSSRCCFYFSVGTGIVSSILSFTICVKAVALFENEEFNGIVPLRFI